MSNLSPAAILHNTGGTEVGTLNAPLRTDPTGTTTQPVSGPLTDAQLRASSVSVSLNSQPLPTGASTEATLVAVNAKLPVTLGQKTSANSLTVTIASDQSVLPTSVASLPLPSGAATSALQTTGNTSLFNLDTKTPTLGQKTMTASQPVVIASDQSTLPTSNASASQVDGHSASIGATADADTANTVIGRLKQIITRLAGGLPSALVSGRLDTNTGAWLGSPAPTVGQKTMAASIPVTISSDQAAIVVTGPSATAIDSGFAVGDIQTSSIAEFLIQRTAYVEQTTQAQRSVRSSSASDTAAGTGARTIKIEYYTAAGVGPLTVNLTLNGTTAVNTGVSDICFINSITCLTAGSNNANVGTISLYTGIGGAGSVFGSIRARDNQTFWCHRYIGVGKIGNITAQWAGHTGTTVGSGATFLIKSRAVAMADAVEIQISDSFRLYGQSSSAQRNYGTALKAVGPCKITTFVIPETSTSTNYRASFDFYVTTQ